MRKGEKGTGIIFTRRRKRTASADADTGEAVKDHIPMLRGFTVFNSIRSTGLMHPAPSDRRGFDLIAIGEAVMQAAGVPVHHGGGARLLRPARIRSPRPTVRFEKAEDYYATALHDDDDQTPNLLRPVNATNIENSKVSYAFEERVAEMGLAF